MTEAHTSTPTTCLIHHMSWLEVSGPDTLKFLQGQTTCDVVKAPVGMLFHGAHCSPKGRMIANFNGVKLNEQTVLLQVPSDIASVFIASLGKYIVFSKATIKALEWKGMGMTGSLNQVQSINNLAPLNEELPTVANQTVQKTDGSLVICRSENAWELWSTAHFDQINPSAPCTFWQQLDIEHARGWVTTATKEVFLPQELNLQAESIAGISFTKGCYTGQEIVARLHYKGQLKQHMHLFSAANDIQEIRPGVDVFNKETGRKAGTVVNAINTNDGWRVLAVVADSALSTVVMGDESHSALTPLSLPYAITKES